MGLTASQILALLAQKHKDDLFVSECKEGSTWSGGPTLRLDAWAMRRSWTKWTTWGYEIKVDRSDFVADDKWSDYLPLCHHFSFVSPYHMIEPEEVPEGIGLLWVTKEGHRIYTKRKPVEKKIETPIALLLYILMCRSVIVPNMYFTRGQSNREYWTAWLQQKENDQMLGAQVRTRLHHLITELQRRARIAESQLATVKETQTLIETAIGIPLSQLSSWDRKAELQELLRGVPKDLPLDLVRVRDSLAEVIEHFKRVGVIR